MRTKKKAAAPTAATVNRKELLAAVVKANRFVIRRSSIPILSTVLLRASNDGALVVQATDLDNHFETAVPISPTVPFSVSVASARLAQILKKVSSETIRLRAFGEGSDEFNRWIEISDEAASFKVYGFPGADFPNVPSLGEKVSSFEIPSCVDFARAIDRSVFAISSEESRFQLSGALLQLRGSAYRLLATDGHRLSIVNVGGFDGLPEAKPLIPRKALALIAQNWRRFQGPVGVDVGDHFVRFRLGADVVVTRALEGSFPDADRLVRRGDGQRLVVSRGALIATLNRALSMTRGCSPCVQFTARTGRLWITSRDPEIGRFAERLEIESELASDAVIALNAEYALEALKSFDGASEIAITLYGPDHQSRFDPAGDSGDGMSFVHVIMPMRSDFVDPEKKAA